MLSVDQIEAIADELTEPMRHVVMRCSDAGWNGEETGYPRMWPDVVANRPHCSFRHTVAALARRGIVQISAPKGCCSMVALTRTGLRVQAALRLREV